MAHLLQWRSGWGLSPFHRVRGSCTFLSMLRFANWKLLLAKLPKPIMSDTLLLYPILTSQKSKEKGHSIRTINDDLTYAKIKKLTFYFSELKYPNTITVNLILQFNSAALIDFVFKIRQSLFRFFFNQLYLSPLNQLIFYLTLKKKNAYFITPQRTVSKLITRIYNFSFALLF